VTKGQVLQVKRDRERSWYLEPLASSWPDLAWSSSPVTFTDRQDQVARSTNAGGDYHWTLFLNSPGVAPYSSENDREKWLRLANPDSMAMEPMDLRVVRSISAECRNRTCRTNAIGVSLKHFLNRSEKAERLIIAVDAID